jgi:hypothetical protein
MKSISPKPIKKPYQTPKLLVYGDLAEMTRTTGKLTNRDGAIGSVKKTA